jgi:hypothetical protein
MTEYSQPDSRQLRPLTAGRLLVPPEQREVLCQALADAVRYRDPPVECIVCEALDGLCGECAAGLGRARSYLALGRELGVEVPD